MDLRETEREVCLDYEEVDNGRELFSYWHSIQYLMYGYTRTYMHAGGGPADLIDLLSIALPPP